MHGFTDSYGSFKINPYRGASNLTLALTDINGNTPSPTYPVRVRIGNTIRQITSPLYVQLADGTNWFNAGSTELATKEIDYFAYLGYNATDGVTIGIARFGAAGLYGDFNTTPTNALYAGLNTRANAAAGDEYTVIGRFAATLSAGAGYTWSVPTYTNDNLIQYPIYETRWLTWQPVYSASASMTWTSVSTNRANYKIIRDTLFFAVDANGTTGGTADKELDLTIPMAMQSNVGVAAGGSVRDGVGAYINGVLIPATSSLGFRRYDGVSWGLGTTRSVSLSSFYRVF